MTSCMKTSISDVMNKSVLIVEDSALFNNALRKGLETLGYQVLSVFTLGEALAALEANSYDLVVLDLHLPDGEGEDLLEGLNTRQKLKIMIYTSDADKERRNEWFRYGVLGYLSKNDPFGYVVQEIDNTIRAIGENTLYNWVYRGRKFMFLPALSLSPMCLMPSEATAFIKKRGIWRKSWSCSEKREGGISTLS